MWGKQPPDIKLSNWSRWPWLRERWPIYKLFNDTIIVFFCTTCLSPELTAGCWKQDFLYRAAAPSVISPLFTTNCDHYSTEAVSDSIIAISPVEASPFRLLSPESPHGCQIPSDFLRSINILSSSIRGAGDKRLEKRTVLGIAFFQEREPRETAGEKWLRHTYLRGNSVILHSLSFLFISVTTL